MALEAFVPTLGPLPEGVPEFPNYPLSRDHIKKDPNGVRRGKIKWQKPDVAWINTGSKCHNACAECFMNSNPENNWLLFISAEQARGLIDEAQELGFQSLGFTGGEPFMNPDFSKHILPYALETLDVTLLSDGGGPLSKPPVAKKLINIVEAAPHELYLRLSLDSPEFSEHNVIRNHGRDRMKDQFMDVITAIKGMGRVDGIHVSVAGQYLNNDAQAKELARERYMQTFKHFEIDPDEVALTLFPKMDRLDPSNIPTITPSCVRGKTYQCASSPMACVPKDLGEIAVYACTVTAHNPGMLKGNSFREAMNDTYTADRHCLSFCVQGGASCAAK